MSARALGLAVGAVVLTIGLSGCGGGMSNFEKFDSCQEAVDATKTETALRNVLSTQPQCVEIQGHIGMYRYAGEDHDMVVLESNEAGGFSLHRPQWLHDLYEKRYLAQKKKADAEWREELKAMRNTSPDLDEPDYGGSSGGSCYYDPTYNYDWHDDYVCGGERQYFRPWDDFVTRDEMVAAVAEWERRNG